MTSTPEGSARNLSIDSATSDQAQNPDFLDDSSDVAVQKWGFDADEGEEGDGGDDAGR